MKVELIEGADDKAALCRDMLMALPAWFGDDEINLEYIEDVRSRMMFVAYGPDGMLGLLSLSKMTDSAYDIHVLGVMPAQHRHGIGRTLVSAAKGYAQHQGAAFLTVKTLGPSVKNADYAATRAFYRAVGFSPLEENKEIWEGTPCLIMCQSVRP